MKRDFNIALRNMDGSIAEQRVPKLDPEKGTQMVDSTGYLLWERTEPMPLKKPIFELLGAKLRGDDNMSGADMLARYRLGDKIAVAGDKPTELTAEDVKVLMIVLEKGATPALYGFAKKVLDTDPAKT